MKKLFKVIKAIGTIILVLLIIILTLLEIAMGLLAYPFKVIRDRGSEFFERLMYKMYNASVRTVKNQRANNGLEDEDTYP